MPRLLSLALVVNTAIHTPDAPASRRPDRGACRTNASEVPEAPEAPGGQGRESSSSSITPLEAVASAVDQGTSIPVCSDASSSSSVVSWLQGTTRRL